MEEQLASAVWWRKSGDCSFDRQRLKTCNDCTGWPTASLFPVSTEATSLTLNGFTQTLENCESLHNTGIFLHPSKVTFGRNKFIVRISTINVIVNTYVGREFCFFCTMETVIRVKSPFKAVLLDRKEPFVLFFLIFWAKKRIQINKTLKEFIVR